MQVLTIEPHSVDVSFLDVPGSVQLVDVGNFLKIPRSMWHPRTNHEYPFNPEQFMKWSMEIPNTLISPRIWCFRFLILAASWKYWTHFKWTLKPQWPKFLHNYPFLAKLLCLSCVQSGYDVDIPLLSVTHFRSQPVFLSSLRRSLTSPSYLPYSPCQNRQPLPLP